MLNLEEITTFRAVASSSNFTVAAQQLHVTQSTVSHQIKRLEKHLGHKLFVRTTRSVHLTQAGERLLPYADNLIETAKAAQQSIAVEQIKGEVRIGVPEEIAYQHLPELLSRFRLHYPMIALDIEVGMGSLLLEKMRMGELDIAILKEVPPTDACSRSEPLVWAGRREVLDINPLPLGFLPCPCTFRTTAIDALEEAQRDYSVVLTSASLEALRIAAEAGSVLTILAQSQCPTELRLDILKNKLPVLPTMGYRIKTNPTQKKPVMIATNIIHELLV